MKNLKTTLRARLMRLCILGVTGTGVILTVAASLGALNVSYSNNIRLGECITNNCAASVSDEVDFLAECLSSAEVSEDGDSTFDRVSLLTDNVYNIVNGENTLSEMNDGDFAILPTAEQDGEPINLTAYKADGNVLVGKLAYDYLSAYLDGIDEDEFAFVTDRYGNVIISSDEEYRKAGINAAELGFADVLESLRNGEAGHSASSSPLFDGDSAFISYAVIGEADYFVIYAADYADLFSSYFKLLFILIVLQLVCIAAAIIVSLKVSKAVLAPVSNTTDRLVKLSEGDLSTPCVSNDRGDETQVLAEALQKTVSVLSAYIKDIYNVLSEISEGNLNARSSVEYEGDFVGIKTSLDGIASHLKETMTAINSVGGKVLADSETLSSGSQLLAGNTANEAAAIEEITSMTEGIESGAVKNTEITGRASQLLVNVMDDIETGGRTVSDMNESMNEIKATSDEIQSVISIIEDIAFQTNILALNAAVEAARAGEAGKGFAVVADEVRTLAARSSEAAKDTLALVERSSVAVNKGAEVAKRTKDSFEAISGSAEEFAKLMEVISAESEEQTKAIKEINAGLESITTTIQSNSASAQESAASSLELKAQADILHSQVSKFRI